MSEGFDSYATPIRNYEKSVLTDEEKVVSALTYSLNSQALVLWMAMKDATSPATSFVRWVEEFNATSAEERGKGKYDHGRPGEENVDIIVDLKTAPGYPLTVTLHKNGEITFATSLSQ